MMNFSSSDECPKTERQLYKIVRMVKREMGRIVVRNRFVEQHALSRENAEEFCSFLRKAHPTMQFEVEEEK